MRQSLQDSRWTQQSQLEGAWHQIEVEESYRAGNSQNQEKTAQSEIQRDKEHAKAQRANDKRRNSDALDHERTALDSAVHWLTRVLSAAAG